jgi:hypothetical protein
MPQTYEDKLELLKRAREARKVKYQKIKEEKILNTPPPGRPKKKQEIKTLDLGNTDDIDEKEEPKQVIEEPEQEEEEAEIVEEIVEIQKIQKPKKKKKIIKKKIIQQYESSSTEEEEEEEEIIYQTIAKPKKVVKEAQEIEQVKTVSVPKNPFFCY